VQAGIVCDAEGMLQFLRTQIVPSLCAFELPMLSIAHAAARAGYVEQLAALDRELEARKLAAELRLASRRMGSRRLALVRTLAPAELLDAFAARNTPQHHLIVCALELRSLPVAAAGCAFALQTLGGYVSAGVKLLRLGQEKAQSILRSVVTELAPAIEPAVAGAGTIVPGWFNPLLEIASFRHARARERLFIS
jgi:urease accessory protein